MQQKIAIRRIHASQTSPGSAQVVDNPGLAQASVNATSLGSA